MRWNLEIETTEADDSKARRRMEAAQRYLASVFQLNCLSAFEVNEDSATPAEAERESQIQLHSKSRLKR